MKKIVYSFSVAFFLVFIAMGKAQAAVTVQDQIDGYDAAIEYNITSSQPTLESFNDHSIDNTMIKMFQGTMGKSLKKDPQTGEAVYVPGLVGNMTDKIAWMLGTPVANTQTAVADLLNTAGIIQPAYAQGLGFASLDPILNTWKVFRNMAYLIFVVVFMVIGFLIMMRQKVSGQTVVTAQQAIPHIIVSLLLVTFSYAIAGLLIDFMYLVMYLLLALFGKDQKTFLNKNFLSLGWTMITSGSSTAYTAVQNFGESLQSSMGQLGQEALSLLGGLTMVVVVALAISLKIFELFFELLKTYVTIVLNVAFAPIILALGAIPGKNVFGQWIQDLVGNLAAFPAVLLVLIVFDELTGGFSGNTVPIENGGFQPPYLFGSGSAGSLPFMVGVGMLTIMPEIVKQAKKALGAKEGIFTQFAHDIGQSMKKSVKGGGELIPGFGFTKVPGVAEMAGWSGKQFNKYIGRPTVGQIRKRYAAGGMREVLPRDVQTIPTEIDIPEELQKGRSDARTPLGKISNMDRGARRVQNRKKSKTL